MFSLAVGEAFRASPPSHARPRASRCPPPPRRTPLGPRVQPARACISGDISAPLNAVRRWRMNVARDERAVVSPMAVERAVVQIERAVPIPPLGPA